MPCFSNPLPVIPEEGFLLMKTKCAKGQSLSFKFLHG
jgi:hypothetical protein